MLKLSRRDFSKALVASGASYSLGGSFAAAAEPLLTAQIPSSGERIPMIGVGTSRYGVGDDAQLLAPLRDALRTFQDLGGTVIDTAPMYRSSEVVLGQLSRELGIVSDLFMATKVDVEGQDEVSAEIGRSEERLQKPELDLVQVHNFIGWEDALPVLQEMKKDGRIRYLGITTSRQRQYNLMEKVMTDYDLDFIQVNYSLANQRVSAKRILPLAADRGMAVLVNRPFGGGGVFKTLSKSTVPEWANDFGVSSWAQFLLKYVLSHPSVSCAIPGMTKAKHVEDNMGAARGRLPSPAERSRMETFFDGL